MNNAIDTQRYIFDSDTRERMRKEMELEDSFVIGHIGRFNYQKNHEFLIDIFNEISKKEPKARLLLVGDGNLRPEIESKITRFGISDKVIMTGVRSDVPDLLQAMDCFVFPSHYEGLPVTVVESQAAGLKCFISEAVTREVDITGRCEFLHIDNPKGWADKILSCNLKKVDTYEQIKAAGYDINTTAKQLQKFYLQKSERK